MKKNKYLLILRSVPGGGKSTYAKKLKQRFLCFCFAHGKGYFDGSICSADDYFLRPDKIYDWNKKLLPNAHNWCYLKIKDCMRFGNNLIILDNTNIRKKDYQNYVDLAKECGYTVKERIIGKIDISMAETYAKRNIHNVPLETIKRMIERFEK